MSDALQNLVYRARGMVALRRRTDPWHEELYDVLDAALELSATPVPDVGLRAALRQCIKILEWDYEGGTKPHHPPLAVLAQARATLAPTVSEET